MSGAELAALAGISGVIIGVLTTHYGAVSNLKSKAAVHDTEIAAIKQSEHSCRKELVEKVDHVIKDVGDIKETLARMNGVAHGDSR